MRAVASIIIFILTMWFIYNLMGIFKVVEELLIGIIFIAAFCVMLIPTFLWHLITNQPTRSTRFKISTDPTTHRNLGSQNSELPNLNDGRTWWSGAIYLEAEMPIKVNDLQLKLKRKRYHAHDFEEVELNGAQDLYWQHYNFAIPYQTDFGKQKAEIIAITAQDDYGSGEIILRD